MLLHLAAGKVDGALTVRLHLVQLPHLRPAQVEATTAPLRLVATVLLKRLLPVVRDTRTMIEAFPIDPNDQY